MVGDARDRKESNSEMNLCQVSAKVNGGKIHPKMDWRGERQIDVPGWVAFFAGAVSFFVSFVALYWAAIYTGLVKLIILIQKDHPPPWVLPVVFGVSIVEGTLVARLVFRAMQNKYPSRSK